MSLMRENGGAKANEQEIDADCYGLGYFCSLISWAYLRRAYAQWSDRRRAAT